MKIYSVLQFFFLLFIPQVSFAQNDYDQFLQLSYTEIDSLMYIEYNKGDFLNAIPLMKAGREKANKEFGEQDTTYANYCSWGGFLYHRIGKYDKALPLYFQCSSIFEKVLGKDHPKFLQSLHSLALTHEYLKNDALALALYNQLINIKQKTLGLMHPEVADIMNDLALFHEDRGDYFLALSLLHKIKNIRLKTLGKENLSYGMSLHNLARVYLSIEKNTLALPLLIEAKNIKEKAVGKEHPSYAQSLNGLAIVYKRMGYYQLALPLFLEAINIIEKTLGNQHPEFVNSLIGLAHFYQGYGDYKLALPLLIQAKDITKQNFGSNHLEFAQVITELALYHQQLQEFDVSLPLLIQAKNIKEKVLGNQHPDFAQSLINLAGLYLSIGEFNQITPLLSQAKQIFNMIYGNHSTKHNEIIRIYTGLYVKTKNYEKAIQFAIQDISNYQQIYEPGHPYISAAFSDLSQIYIYAQKYNLAWETIHKSINILSSKDIPLTINNSWTRLIINETYPSNLHIDFIIKAVNKAYQFINNAPSIENRDTKKAILIDIASSLLIKLRQQMADEEDKLRILKRSNLCLQGNLKILSPNKDASRAFNLSESIKSVLLLQATKSETAYRLGELPDSLIWKDKRLRNMQSYIQAQLLENRPNTEKDSLRDQLNHVNQHIYKFLELIKKEYPKYHKLKYKPIDTKAEEIQALLDDNTALLEYVIGDSVIHIFLVDKMGVEWKKSFVANKELNDNIKALHQALSNYELVPKDKEKAYKNYTEKAHWFYQLLIEPILKDKQGIKDLIIVTDGELGHLPFETFLVEQAPKSITDYHELYYLVNDFNISYNYSATLWKENKEAAKPNNNGQMLAMAANYDIKLDSSMMDVRLPTDQWLRELLNPLPAARKEVETLQEKYDGFFAFDSLASEKTVKAKAADYSILHFATHGILDTKRPVLSSLAMTEDNDSIESNFWQAHEISKMELNADLVVLSACETGYGKFEAGNGIASLARAFMYAGASSLIVSLWQVNDYATSEIMKNLYDNLANGMKKDEALRQAKIQYMKSAKGMMAHPAFWSPFIMMGKTDAVYLKTKGGYFWWGIGAGILALGGIAVVMQNRRKE